MRTAGRKGELSYGTAAHTVTSTGWPSCPGDRSRTRYRLAGAHVVLVARTASEVNEVAESIRGDGGTAENITLDITDLDAAARRMVESGKRGSIINISSDMGLVGGPNRTVYCSTKHGMEGMTKLWRLTSAHTGFA
jgi:NAD(P)-dependent dehydrogenase (short-subunit alcohol dehydrogenase family)